MSLKNVASFPHATLSIVAPCYNERDCLPELLERISAVTFSLNCKWEFILVDDSSSDGSWEIILELRRQYPQLRALRLTRNFGQQQAILAGLTAAQGNLFITLDSDLQDPPEIIPEMLKKLQGDIQIVYARRSDRQFDPLSKRFFARSFYWFIRKATKLSIPINAGEFRLFTLQVRQSLLALNEPRPFLRGMFAWLGFPSAHVFFQRPPRFAGTTKFPFRKSAQLALDAIVGFSQPSIVFLVLLTLLLGLGVGVFLLAQSFGAEISIILLITILLLLGTFITTTICCSLILRQMSSSRPGFVIMETVGWEEKPSAKIIHS